VYEKNPITIEQAINVDHKKHNLLKVELSNKEILILDSIYYKENNLYGLIKKPKGDVKATYTERKYTYDGWPYTYTYSRIVKVKEEREIEENEIYQIFVPERPKNNVFVNLVGGNGSIYSINYERIFEITPSLLVAGGLGIGMAVDDILYGTGYRTFPHHITLNYGKDNVFFEFGIGATTAYGLETQYFKYYLFPIIGCRVQPLRPPIRFFFRFQFILPVKVYEEINWAWEDMLIMPIGISLGVSF
jgi:hypothetical protein